MLKDKFSDSSNINIRLGLPSDYKACRILVNQKDNREGFGWFDRVSFDEFATKQKQDPRYILWVAEKNNEIVGFVRALLLKNKSQTTIHAICRHKDHKGTGLGQYLLNLTEEFSRQNDIPLIRLKTPDKTNACKAYERYGFQCAAIVPPEGNRKRAVRIYEKKL